MKPNTSEVDRLKSLLAYDAETGAFTWLEPRGGQACGSPAGCRNRNGYIEITVHRRIHKAHRLAWLYVHGEWPPHEIDHINGDKADFERILLWNVLDHDGPAPTVIIEGEAIGADQCARRWAKARGVEVDPYPVDISKDGRLARCRPPQERPHAPRRQAGPRALLHLRQGGLADVQRERWDARDLPPRRDAGSRVPRGWGGSVTLFAAPSGGVAMVGEL